MTADNPFPQVPLDLGPLRGDYTFFLVANTTEQPAGSDCTIEWRGPSGQIWLSETQQPRDPWQSTFAVQRASVDVGGAVVTLYAHFGSVGPCQVRYVRAIAVRNDAFASVAYARDDNNVLSTMAAPMFGAQLDPPAATEPARDYVFISSLRLDEECTNLTDAERGVHIIADLTSTRQELLLVHATDNCGYQPTYGTMQVLPTQPAHVAVGYSARNGEAVNYRGSQVLVLGVR